MNYCLTRVYLELVRQCERMLYYLVLGLLSLSFVNGREGSFRETLLFCCTWSRYKSWVWEKDVAVVWFASFELI